MEDCRGCRHVAQLITAFREKDQVVVIMPYHRNVDFRVRRSFLSSVASCTLIRSPQNYFTVVPLLSIQQYMRCLLRALRDIHSRQIIHRDIKPANFLFDPATGQGVVVDFGLAQVSPQLVYQLHTCLIEHVLQKSEFGANTSCNHDAPSREHPHGALKSFSKEDMEEMRANLHECRRRAAGPSDKVGWFAEDTRLVDSNAFSPARGDQSSLQRLHIKANRAGTRGFRAPEVLFKCEYQSAGTASFQSQCSSSDH